jgi:hypothetical protein
MIRAGRTADRATAQDAKMANRPADSRKIETAVKETQARPLTTACSCIHNPQQKADFHHENK